ncbi:MAG: DUF3365 domain-containing protein [Planctomycetaceae bacterium]
MARGILLTLFSGYLMLASSPAFSEESPTADSKSKPAVRVSVAEARRQAEVLHTAMHATVQLVHHRYYKLDEGLPIPAAVVDEIFSEIAAEQQVELRWLAVEGQAMNTDHIARDDFEKAAVEALKAGKLSHEQVQDGILRRAAPITLSNQCLKCHVPDRKSTQDRKAGLIISIPVAER